MTSDDTTHRLGPDVHHCAQAKGELHFKEEAPPFRPSTAASMYASGTTSS